MRTTIALVTFVSVLHQVQAQRSAGTTWPACDPAKHGIEVHPLYSDSLASSFIICVHDSVPPHFHRSHTEHVTVLQGTGEMMLGDTTFTLAPGDVIVIPRNTPHAARRTSAEELRVLSVQAPYFDGSDRVRVQP